MHEDSDSEESDHLADVDEFEHDYNFRFEEEGGTEIQTHARNVPNSVQLILFFLFVKFVVVVFSFVKLIYDYF